MANKFTQQQWGKIKNRSLCVVSFKNGNRTLTYANLSYKEAMEHVFAKQLNREVCLIIPFSNTIGLKGLETREYKEEEETLDYYLKCIQENNELIKRYFLLNLLITEVVVFILPLTGNPLFLRSDIVCVRNLRCSFLLLLIILNSLVNCNSPA